MTCGSCSKDTKTTFCEEVKKELCRDCCLKRGGGSCFWIKVCW